MFGFVYRNPARDAYSIAMTLRRDDSVTFQVADLLG
jgi:hypothetical protein